MVQVELTEIVCMDGPFPFGVHTCNVLALPTLCWTQINQYRE